MSCLRSVRFLATQASSSHVHPVVMRNVKLSMRRSYTTAEPGKTPADEGGSNPLLWIGCISLGVAYTYYQKKQDEKTATVKEEVAEVTQMALDIMPNCRDP